MFSRGVCYYEPCSNTDITGEIMNHRVTSKEHILEHAMRLAMEKGVDYISIRKLAGDCGISIGSVYNYYANKEELIAAVTENFWSGILENQEMVYRRGMGFTMFLEQYYRFLYGRLSKYDSTWLGEMNGNTIEQNKVMMAPCFEEAKRLIKEVLARDERVRGDIWNMELNKDAFCDYVFTNFFALLRAGESNCRFFLFLLEHLLYKNS